MPALQTLLAHVFVTRAGKMPALQYGENAVARRKPLVASL
jgi:hypothetical protein